MPQLWGDLLLNVLLMTLHRPQSQKLAALNDQARQSMTGCTLFLTKGIFELPELVQDAILAKVRDFGAFTPDNDPYGEHDFGAFDFAGERIYWKFDYYDPNMQFGSSDPTDPAQTTRVLTVLLADEW